MWRARACVYVSGSGTRKEIARPEVKGRKGVERSGVEWDGLLVERPMMTEGLE